MSQHHCHLQTLKISLARFSRHTRAPLTHSIAERIMRDAAEGNLEEWQKNREEEKNFSLTSCCASN